MYQTEVKRNEMRIKTPFYRHRGVYWWKRLVWIGLSTSGSSPSGAGNPVCGGCEGTLAGREGSIACIGTVWHASHTPPSSRTLHALQDHSKNGLEYLQGHEQSFHARYLRHRYKNAQMLNSGKIYSQRTPHTDTVSPPRDYADPRGRTISSYASSFQRFSSGSAADSWRNWWRRNCSRWSGPTGGQGGGSPRFSELERKHCDIWSSVGDETRQMRASLSTQNHSVSWCQRWRYWSCTSPLNVH